MSAIAFLAGLGAGATQSDRVERELAIREAEEGRRKQLFDATMAERERAAREAEELRAAAAPLPVQETQIEGPTQPGEAPLPVTPIANGRRFASMAGAQEAMNGGSATRGRIVQALERQGRVVEADKMRTSGLQADAAEMQMKKLTEAALKEGTLDFLGQAMAGASPEALIEQYNKNGKGRLVDVKVEPFEFNHPTLGKQRSARITGKLEDGKQFEISDAFDSSLSLFGAAKRFDLELNWRKEKRAEDKDSRMLDIQQQNADTNERFRRDQAENMRQQRALEGQRIAALTAKSEGPGQPLQISVKDMRDFQGDVREQTKELFPIKEGADPAERAKIAAQAAAAEARAVSVFRDNAKIGNPLVASTVLQAIQLAGDPKNERIVQVGEQKFGAVMVNGQPVIVTGALQPKPQPATPSPAATPPIAPVQPPAAPLIQAAPPAAPAAAAFSPQHMAALQPLNEQVAQLSKVLAAVANSGDQRAIAAYQQQLTMARAAREREAVARLGPNGAAQYLSTLPF